MFVSYNYILFVHILQCAGDLKSKKLLNITWNSPLKNINNYEYDALTDRAIVSLRT